MGLFQALWPPTISAANGGDPCPSRRWLALRPSSKELGQNYSHLEAAFTYASLGVLTLSIDGDWIHASDEFRRDTREQAAHWTRLSCHRFRANEVRLS